MNTEGSGLPRAKIYITAVFLLFLELTVFERIRVLNASPDLLAVLTVYVGLHFGAAAGGEIGFVNGLLKDTASASGLGINILSFLFLGILSGLLKNKVFKGNFATQFFLCFFSVYVLSVFYFVYLNRITGTNAGLEFWNIATYKGLYTAIVGTILFFVFERLYGLRGV